MKWLLSAAFVAGLAMIRASDGDVRPTFLCKVRSVESWSQVLARGWTQPPPARNQVLSLRGGSWNPVKWFEDAVENTMKEDVKELLHTDKEAADEGCLVLMHVFENNK
jgi:hypothetical protein